MASCESMVPRLPSAAVLLALWPALGCVETPVPVQYWPDGPPQAGEADGGDGGDGGGVDTGADPPAGPLDPVPLLARLSLDLRGTRPTLDEIAAVQADPDALSGLVDAFLADARWRDRVLHTWNDAFHTVAWAAAYERFGELPPEQVRAMGAAPVRMAAAIAWEDRPFTDLVTAEQIQGNSALAELWGIPGPDAPDADGWGWMDWPDGRPMAGVLSSSVLWLRYAPDELQRNRVRANALATTLLCADFLAREGSFEFNVDVDALTDVEDAVASQGECLACHAALDPLASFFGGFTWKSEILDRERYVRWSDHLADKAAGVQRPAYYGVPADDLSGLGQLVAADPRFARCGAERFYRGVVGAAPDPATLGALTEGWVADGMVARALVEDIVALDAYAAADPRVLTPEQLSSALTDLLALPPTDPGSRITQGLDALVWSGEHRVLGGGTDDRTVLDRDRSPGLGMQVLLAWAARSGADEGVRLDLERPLGERALVTAAADAPEEDVRAALARLYTRFLTTPVAADSDEVDRLWGLWQAAGGGSDLQGAWSTVVEGLIRHPSMVRY